MTDRREVLIPPCGVFEKALLAQTVKEGREKLGLVQVEGHEHWWRPKVVNQALAVPVHPDAPPAPVHEKVPDSELRGLVDAIHEALGPVQVRVDRDLPQAVREVVAMAKKWSDHCTGRTS